MSQGVKIHRLVYILLLFKLAMIAGYDVDDILRNAITSTTTASVELVQSTSRVAYEKLLKECMAELVSCLSYYMSFSKKSICGQNEQGLQRQFNSLCDLQYTTCKKKDNWRFIKEGDCARRKQ